MMLKLAKNREIVCCFVVVVVVVVAVDVGNHEAG
jgi:hypothetical protein